MIAEGILVWCISTFGMFGFCKSIVVVELCSG